MSAGRDMLLFGMSQSQLSAELFTWAQRSDVQRFMPDFHRLQLEHWLYSHKAELSALDFVLDIGVQTRREWVGKGYKTFGHTEDTDSDIKGDLCDTKLADASVDALICTEVLEHCEDPFAACREMHRIVKPGGLLLVTSPFFWPWHGTQDYQDFWRFTEDGWRLLFKRFASIDVKACNWTDEGLAFYDLMRRFECMGHAALTHATTGYLCEVRR